MKNMIKVAGVTFTNEDGTSRQEILAGLVGTTGIITVDLQQTTWHNDETNEDEYAIKCIEHNTRKVIGWIPKTELDNDILSSQMTGFIRYYHNKYSVQLDTIKRPSQKQYHAVKALCAKQGRPMVAYDVRAYAYVFEMARAE